MIGADPVQGSRQDRPVHEQQLYADSAARQSAERPGEVQPPADFALPSGHGAARLAPSLP